MGVKPPFKVRIFMFIFEYIYLVIFYIWTACFVKFLNPNPLFYSRPKSTFIFSTFYRWIVRPMTGLVPQVYFVDFVLWCLLCYSYASFLMTLFLQWCDHDISRYTTAFYSQLNISTSNGKIYFMRMIGSDDSDQIIGRIAMSLRTIFPGITLSWVKSILVQLIFTMPSGTKVSFIVIFRIYYAFLRSKLFKSSIQKAAFHGGAYDTSVSILFGKSRYLDYSGVYIDRCFIHFVKPMHEDTRLFC